MDEHTRYYLQHGWLTEQVTEVYAALFVAGKPIDMMLRNLDIFVSRQNSRLAAAEQRAERLAGALRDLLGFCAPLMRLTAGNDEQWENAVREARAALDDNDNEGE